MEQQQPTRYAVLIPVICAGLVSFAFSAILIRWAGEAPPLTIAVWRTVLAAVLLAPVAWPFVAKEVRTFTRREWVMTAAAGAVLSLHFVAFIEGLFYTSIASATVLVTTSPLFLAVLAYLFLGERLRLVTIAAIALATVAAAVLGWTDAGGIDGGTRPLLGNVLAVSAAFLASVYLLLGRVVRQRRSFLAYLVPLYVFVAVSTLLLGLIRGVPLLGFSATFYALCLLMALGPSLLGHGSLNYALRYLPAAIVGMLALTEPVGASLLAYVFFGEAPSALGIIAMVVVLASVGLAIWFSQRRAPKEEAAGPS